MTIRRWSESQAVLNDVNRTFERTVSNTTLVQSLDSGAECFQALASVFDRVLSGKSGPNTLALAGELEWDSPGTQAHDGQPVVSVRR